MTRDELETEIGKMLVLGRAGLLDDTQWPPDWSLAQAIIARVVEECVKICDVYYDQASGPFEPQFQIAATHLKNRIRALIETERTEGDDRTCRTCEGEQK